MRTHTHINKYKEKMNYLKLTNQLTNKMKKLLLMLLALVATSAWAQTDVTNDYISNADFSSQDGWTQDHSDSFWALDNGLIGTLSIQNNKTSSTDETHLATEYCFGIQCRWSTNYAAFTQETQTLPVGVYTLTFDVQNKNGSNNVTYENRFKVTIGGTTYTDNSTEWMRGSSNWTTHTITFNVTEATTATISLGYGTGSNNIGSTATPHLYVSHLKLTWTDPLQAAKEALQAEIDKAKLCDAKEGLADAIAAAENALANATTNTELQEALAALQAADKDAVLRYENGLADAAATNGMVTSFVVNGTFDSNVNGWSRTGGFQNNGIASNQQGDFTVPFYENWNGSAKANKMYQTINNIPNGTYKLKIAAFVNTLADPNESQYVFANEDKTYLTTGDPTFYEVWTVVTNNTVEVGLEQTTATANWMGIDNVSLTYYGAGDVRDQAQAGSHKTDWDEALAAAQAAIANTDYSNVTGSEKTALEAEIAKAEPTTADGYDAATAALRAATNAFTAAKTNYDIFAQYNADLTYADAAKKPVISNESTAESVITALRAYYESHALAEGVEDAVDKTSVITNANNPTNNDGWTWTGNKNNPASNEPWTDADGTNEHSYFDGGNWGANSWTTTMEQTITIPSGRYLLTAKGRAAVNTTLTMSVGEESVELPHVGSTGNVFDRGWGDASLEFETTDGSATIKVTATSSTLHEWFSISNFRLVQLEEIVVPMADADDYAALASAIADAETNTLGFDAGEYAPYNNVEALQALAAAKAIDPEATDGNTKEVVNNATSALTNASWTANEVEVNAIYDGNFSIQPEHTTGPTALTGWNNPQGIRQLIKNTETYLGLNSASAKAAVFAWGNTTMYYGDTEGYTMPLAAHTLYELSFKTCGWIDGDMGYVNVDIKNSNNEGLQTVNTVTATKRINESDPWDEFKVFFETGEAGNYRLGMWTSKHTTFTDLVLKKAVAEEITLNETEEYTAVTEDIYANVTMNRKVVAGINAVAVPFDLTTEQVKAVFGENAQVYTFEDVPDGENSQINFNTKEENTIEANVPVLVGGATESPQQTINGVILKAGEAKVTGTNFDFVGNYAGTVKVAANDYFVSGGKLYKSEGNTNLKSFRAFIQNKANTNGNVKLCIDGVATSIEAIENGQLTIDNEAIYNLAGQRVSKATKGIFIKNGKKVVVK